MTDGGRGTMTVCTRTPCVCVKAESGKSVSHKTSQPKPQEGGLCVQSHTLFASLFALLLLLLGAKLHTQTHTERVVCVQSVYTLLEGKDV